MADAGWLVAGGWGWLAGGVASWVVLMAWLGWLSQPPKCVAVVLPRRCAGPTAYPGQYGGVPDARVLSEKVVVVMNVDALINTQRHMWDRLQQLSTQRNVSSAEAEEMLDCYRQAGIHLSWLRTHGVDTRTTSALSQRLILGRRALTGASEPFLAECHHFFTVAMPTALWRLRWLSLAVALFGCLLATLFGWWVAINPQVQTAMMTNEQIEELVRRDFEAYYSQGHPVGFAGTLWTNNGWLAAINVGTGITGLTVVMSLIVNAINVGFVGGVMTSNGGAATFFSLILPHGLLEITGLFVSAAAGLRLFWAWVAGGRAPRLVTLAKEGRALITVAVALVISMFFSALIEAFVTPSGLPSAVKITIGAAALAAFWWYPWWFGRRAEQRNETGDMRATQRGSETILQG